MMQDPYSMMHRDERFYKYGGRPSSTSSTAPSSYYSMSMPYQQPSHTITQSDVSGLLSNAGPSSSHDYSGVHTSSRQSPTSTLISGTPHGGPSPTNAHQQPSTTSVPLMDLASPIPTGEPIPNLNISAQEGTHEIDSTHLSSPSSTSSGHSTPLDLANDSKIPPKKRPHLTPENQKDEAYWEKRQKNNDSAKRSREARRMKEEQIALRVVFLEQENLQLRTEVSLLKSEIEKLRCMLYNP